MSIIIDLEEFLDTKETRLDPDEWREITGDPRPQLPPCCHRVQDMAMAVRVIYNDQLDYRNAKELIAKYNNVCVGHDYTMFPVLMKLINSATALITAMDKLRTPEPKKPDPNVRGLAGYHGWYDLSDDAMWGV